MEYRDLFEKFEKEGRLAGHDTGLLFGEIGWSVHPVFEGVELKHIVTAGETGGRFSFHLVLIAPGRKIGSHIHKEQLETHEVIAGKGICGHAGRLIPYEPGTVAFFEAGSPHEVEAGTEGLYLFAKFMPALN